MASFLKTSDRRVVPNFRRLSLTEKFGELGPSGAGDKSYLKDIHFLKLLSDWGKEKSIGVAGELISSGFLVDTSDKHVTEAANYILDNSKTSSSSQVSIAKKILDTKEPTNNNLITLERFLEINEKPDIIFNRISKYKKLVREYPESSLGYVELARLYSILGQEEQSKQAMKIALELGFENRYVLRSAVRLFTHFKEFDIPHYYLRKSPVTGHDPWVLSAEIALSTMKKRTSRFLKSGFSMIGSQKFSHFDLTELASSLATVELISGSNKKSKKLFETSLISPNDNSLAQAKWASKKGVIFPIDVEDFDLKIKHEAMAQDAYEKENWTDTIHHAQKWFFDSPFSKRPIELASHVASTINNDNKTAALFCRAGLISHPNDPFLINNLAYSLALSGEVEDAEKCLDNIDIEKVNSESTKACLVATLGLINFRKGEILEGQNLYLDALEKCRKLNDPELTILAILNFIREGSKAEIMAQNEVEDLIDRIPKDKMTKDHVILSDRIKKELAAKEPNQRGSASSPDSGIKKSEIDRFLE